VRARTTAPRRQALDQVGFDFIVESGLGRGHRDFRAARLHTLPASRPAAQIWRDEGEHERVDDRPAYTGMLKMGALDRCGVTLLAGKAVGAPFVGAAAATLAISGVTEALGTTFAGWNCVLCDCSCPLPLPRVLVWGTPAHARWSPA
jgi:hypothetical protein